jgi:hypothetical protein
VIVSGGQCGHERGSGTLNGNPANNSEDCQTETVLKASAYEKHQADRTERCAQQKSFLD